MEKEEENDGSKKITVSFGDLGSQGGSRWDDGIYSMIKRVVIHHKEWICSIQTEYDKDGDSVWSQKHGGNDGDRSEIELQVVLDYPEEFLISIHGYYGEIHYGMKTATVIRSLSLESNGRSYGPYGTEDGTQFSFPTIWGKIVGFHGRCDWYLEAIGLHVQPIQNERKVYEPIHFTLGEYGGKGGSSWEDLFSRIRRFVIYHGQCIDSIQIEYDDKNGNTILSPKHGGNGGSRYEVAFEYPDEYLISINGYYSDTRNWASFTATLIHSLTIKTNRRSYGPFGVENGTKFSIPAVATANRVKIVGIYGRSGLFLDSIGLRGVSIQN